MISLINKWNKRKSPENLSFQGKTKARDGTRTRGLDLGKVALHQLSHSRITYFFFFYLLETRIIILYLPRFVNSYFEIFYIFQIVYSILLKNRMKNGIQKLNKTSLLFKKLENPGTFQANDTILH